MSEKESKKVEKKVKKFMKSVRAFLTEKSGSVRAEWECSLILLETYFEEFLMLTMEIESLDSLLSENRYGVIPHPLLNARDKSAIRLEGLLKSLGCTFKEATKMDIVEPVVEESPLDAFVKNKIEKR
jgi:hypothetical protein